MIFYRPMSSKTTHKPLVKALPIAEQVDHLKALLTQVAMPEEHRLEITNQINGISASVKALVHRRSLLGTASAQKTALSSKISDN